MIESIYRCEICGEETQRPVKWFVIHCGQTAPDDPQMDQGSCGRERGAALLRRGARAGLHQPVVSDFLRVIENQNLIEIPKGSDRPV